MSWLPDKDPVLGDKRSCDALELVLVPRARDIGGFEVRRALPQAKRRMVGPFIFFDQMGPARFAVGQGMDVRPHPHIGLATVTYLFDGRIMQCLVPGQPSCHPFDQRISSCHARHDPGRPSGPQPGTGSATLGRQGHHG